MEHEPVEAPEKRRQRLAGASGGENQRALPARNDGPALALRSGRKVKDGLEPFRRNHMETGKRIGLCDRRRRWVGDGPAGRHACLRITEDGYLLDEPYPKM
jgi:hypothetical protein